MFLEMFVRFLTGLLFVEIVKFQTSVMSCDTEKLKGCGCFGLNYNYRQMNSDKMLVKNLALVAKHIFSLCLVLIFITDEVIIATAYFYSQLNALKIFI